MVQLATALEDHSNGCPSPSRAPALTTFGAPMGFSSLQQSLRLFPHQIDSLLLLFPRFLRIYFCGQTLRPASRFNPSDSWRPVVPRTHHLVSTSVQRVQEHARTGDPLCSTQLHTIFFRNPHQPLRNSVSDGHAPHNTLRSPPHIATSHPPTTRASVEHVPPLSYLHTAPAASAPTRTPAIRPSDSAHTLPSPALRAHHRAHQHHLSHVPHQLLRSPDPTHPADHSQSQTPTRGRLCTHIHAQAPAALQQRSRARGRFARHAAAPRPPPPFWRARGAKPTRGVRAILIVVRAAQHGGL
ncbi:hypothetical protein C2E23DRAFT_550964 [Lenzites betulinus]|nr:hypothetical protein C2E23DRAFT_550964 [Lenzites betulinus]